MSYVQGFVSFKKMGGREHTLKMVSDAAARHMWRDFEVYAVDDRVLWRETPSGVVLYYREAKSDASRGTERG